MNKRVHINQVLSSANSVGYDANLWRAKEGAKLCV